MNDIDMLTEQDLRYAVKRYVWLCERFAGMKTSAAQNMLDALSLDADPCDSLDDIIAAAMLA